MFELAAAHRLPRAFTIGTQTRTTSFWQPITEFLQ